MLVSQVLSRSGTQRFPLKIEALLAWLLSSENLELAQLARRVGWATAAWCRGFSLAGVAVVVRVGNGNDPHKRPPNRGKWMQINTPKKLHPSIG